MVGAVTLAGLRALSPADFADIIVKRVGQTLRSAELATLATDIAGRARGAGLCSLRPGSCRSASPMACSRSASTKAESTKSTSTARCSRHRSRRARAGGQRRASAARRSRAPAARRGRSRWRADPQQPVVREKGKGVLLVRVTQDRVAVRAQLSNEGTRPLGPQQVRIDVDVRSLFAADDALTLTYSATPFQPGELQFARMRYAKQISAERHRSRRHRLGVAHAFGFYLEPLDLRSVRLPVSKCCGLLRRRSARPVAPGRRRRARSRAVGRRPALAPTASRPRG